MVQKLSLALRERREGAGRRPGPNPYVRHRSRPPLSAHYPCHVTVRIRSGPIAPYCPVRAGIRRDSLSGMRAGRVPVSALRALGNHAHLRRSERSPRAGAGDEVRDHEDRPGPRSGRLPGGEGSWQIATTCGFSRRLGRFVTRSGTCSSTLGDTPLNRAAVSPRLSIQPPRGAGSTAGRETSRESWVAQGLAQSPSRTHGSDRGVEAVRAARSPGYAGSRSRFACLDQGSVRL